MPTVLELRVQAKAKGLKGYTIMRKADLEKALKVSQPQTGSKSKGGNPNISGWKIHWKSLAAAKNFLTSDHEIGGKFFEGTRGTFKRKPQYWTDFEWEMNSQLEDEFGGKDLYSRELMTFLSPEWKKYINTKDALTAKKPEQVFERFLDYIDEEKLPKKFADIKANKVGKKGGRPQKK
tara:strand:+ start:467 stop:1000 length:534 start_codon:yes stop_codon:yes gene_type:complete